MLDGRLGGEDAAWLHMEEPENPMVVNGVLELAAPLDASVVRGRLERLAAFPRFRARIVEAPLGLGPPRWTVGDRFDLDQHVERVTLGQGDPAALQRFVGSKVSAPLPLNLPLWKAFIIDRPGAGSAIMCRIHHAIGDGFALLHVLASLADDAAPGTGEPPPLTATGRRAGRPPLARTALEATRALGRLVVMPADPETLLKLPIGPEKDVAWSRPAPLAEVKRVARAASATVNDVLVAVAAGALGRYLGRCGERTGEDLELHAMVPVNLRRAAPTSTLGNRFGLVVLGLPVGDADPLARIAAVKARMRRIKGTPEALATHGLLRALGWAPRGVEDLGVSFFGKKASLVLTNVPGPRAPLHLAGVPISRIVFWVPQAARMGLGISIFSYAGEVTVGVIADTTLIPDPGVLIADIQDELDRLGSIPDRDASSAALARECTARAPH